MDFPKTIPALQLEMQNAEYCPPAIARARALYYAGSEFEALKGKFLYPRALEESGNKAGQGLRKSRMQSAVYTPHIMGQMNFITASIFQNNPGFEFDGPDDRLVYYKKIAAAMPELSQMQVLEMMLYGRGFLTTAFPDTTGDFSDIEAQRGAGDLDAALSSLDFCSVWDWGRNGKNLEWVKTRSCELQRPNAWSIPDTERYTWTFITGDTIAEYTASRSLDKDKQGYKEYAEWVKDAQGKLADEPKEIDGLPITEVALPNGFCLMSALAPLLVSLFNREASYDYALDASAFSMLALFTEEKYSEIFGGEAAVLKLKPQDKLMWAAPQGIVYEALSGSAERKVKAIEKLIHAAAQDLQSFDQHAASGAAKAKDFGPIAMMLLYYASALKRGFQARIDHLIKLRGEEKIVKAKVTGLEDFDLDSLTDKMGFAASWYLLPGRPPTADKALMSDICASVLPDVDFETKKKIADEIKAGVEAPVPGVTSDAVSGEAASTGKASATTTARSASSPAKTSSANAAADKAPPMRIKATLKKIDPRRLDPSHDTDPEARQDIADSIKKNGYDQSKPVLAVEMKGMHKDGGSVYKSLDGHHRGAAARQVGIKTIPAHVVSYQDWNMAQDALGVDASQKLSATDPMIELPDGRTYDKVRDKNDHSNGARSGAASMVKSGVLSAASKN